jgi:hypothetical protein
MYFKIEFCFISSFKNEYIPFERLEMKNSRSWRSESYGIGLIGYTKFELKCMMKKMEFLHFAQGYYC